MTMPAMFPTDSPHSSTEHDLHTRLIIKAVGVLPLELMGVPLGRVLDLGCGMGTWLYEMSFFYPHATFVGTDASPAMIELAQAKNMHRPQVSFDVWDPLSGKDGPFPPDHFDLITLHFASRWVATSLNWLQLINICRRSLKKGGMLLIQENDGLTTTSPVLTRLDDIVRAAKKSAGHSLGGTVQQGTTLPLIGLLSNSGFGKPQVTCGAVDFSYTQEEENYAWRSYFRVLIADLTPFLVRVGASSPEELCQISIQLDMEMFAEAFCGIWTMFTLVCRKPS